VADFLKESGLVLGMGLGLWLVLLFIYPVLIRFLVSMGMQKKNFRNEEIPIGSGLAFLIIQCLVTPFFIFFFEWKKVFLQSGVLVLISLIGWFDDRYAEKPKGIKGHFITSLKRRKPTIGAWKALVGGCIAGWISWIYSTTLSLFLLHFFLIFFLTNFINLLDLRPGRAIKGFFLLFLILFTASRTIPFWLWEPVLLTAAFLLIYDLKRTVMLGDIGANGLGAILGYWGVLYAPFGLKLALVLFTFVAHVYAEKKSITAMIRQHPFLHWIDMLGRKEV
jgi:UDP-GlcNAc:undecaprenyl-phosphate/decaprenyl-phosphate GlcNAc-1-phosphate transferase